MKKNKIERKLNLKKERICELQLKQLISIKGGTEDEEFLSIVSCVTNGRTCGNNCCGTDTHHVACTCEGCW